MKIINIFQLIEFYEINKKIRYVSIFWQCKCSRLQLGVLVDSKEKDVIGLVVVDEEEEGVVGDEVGVEERSGRTEAKEGGGGRGLAALLVDVDEGLVNGA